MSLACERKGPAQGLPWLAVTVWLVFYVPRIATLGFYNSDGWIAAVAAARGHFDYHGSFFAYCADLAAKPVALATHLLALEICRDRAPLWQAALVLAMLACVLTLYGFLRRLEGRRPGKRYSPPADLVAALWLATPLSLGATVLPNMFNALLGQAMFFGFAAVVVRMLDENKPRPGRDLLLAAALLLGSYLSYETYYFQFVTVVGLAACSRRPTPPFGRILSCAGVFGAVQVLCIVYNRSIGRFVPGVGSKSFNADWWNTVRPSAVGSVLSYNLPAAVRPYGPWLLGCGTAMAVVALVAVFLASWRERSLRPWGAFLASLTLLAGAYGVATFTYALAGYGITFLGPESRVAMTPVFILACASWVLLHAAGRIAPLGRISGASAAIALVLFGLLHHRLLTAWELSWDLQRDVLSRLHRHESELRQLGSGSVVVFLGPYYVGPVPVFQADPQLTIAAREEFPFLRTVPRIRPYFLSIYNDYTAVWDGNDMLQRQTGSSRPQVMPAADAWLWNYFTGDFRRLRPGERIDPSAAGAYLTVEESISLLARHRAAL